MLRDSIRSDPSKLIGSIHCSRRVFFDRPASGRHARPRLKLFSIDQTRSTATSARRQRRHGMHDPPSAIQTAGQRGFAVIERASYFDLREQTTDAKVIAEPF